MERVTKTAIAVLLLVLATGCDKESAASSQSSDDTTAAATNASTQVAAPFPRHVETDTADLVYHAPQIRSWTDFSKATALEVVEIHLKGEPKPYLMTAKVTFRTEPDTDRKLVTVTDVALDDYSFKGVPAGRETSDLEALVKNNSRQGNRTVPLDLFLSYLASDAIPASDPGIKSTPPKIYVAYQRTIIVILDGEPALAPIEGTGLSFAVNTNWPLFQSADTKHWYLFNEDQWLTADSLEGDWAHASKLPDGFSKLPDNDNWKDIKANLDRLGEDTRLPRVIVSTQPAELIEIDGKPELEAIADTGLEYVTNTKSDLFREENVWYYLVSGRWFQAPSLDGSWSTVKKLPKAFAEIPSDSKVAAVLVSVPGTTEATIAAMEAEVPKKNTVARDAKPPVSPTYAGKPEFEDIQGTDLKRAVNTGYDVIEAGGLYYLCYGGIWYMSASSEGPWSVAASVPPGIYDIPPSSPAYNTTYVHVQETSPTSVTYIYTSGYTGMYVSGGTVVWGTGWAYPPYMYWAHGYPIYYPPAFTTWGSSAWYNPSTGTYGRGVRAYGPYGGYGYASTYNPSTGRYGRAEASWNGNEAYMNGETYNPRTGVSYQTQRSYDANGNNYSSSSQFQRGDKTVNVNRSSDTNSGTTKISGSDGGSAKFHRQQSGDGWDTSSTINTKDGRTITGSGEFSAGEGSASLKSSAGGSGTINRSIENGQVTREGEFTGADGKQVSTKSAGGPGGPTMVQGEQGTGAVVGQGLNKTFVGKSDQGDLYAANDGNVYKHGDDGWYKQGDDGNWNPVGGASSNGGQRSFGDGTGGYQQRAASSTQWSSNRSGDTFSQLNSDFNARQQGMNRFQGRSSFGGGRFGGGSFGGGRFGGGRFGRR